MHKGRAQTRHLVLVWLPQSVHSALHLSTLCLMRWIQFPAATIAHASVSTAFLSVILLLLLMTVSQACCRTLFTCCTVPCCGLFAVMGFLRFIAILCSMASFSCSNMPFPRRGILFPLLLASTSSHGLAVRSAAFSSSRSCCSVGIRPAFIRLITFLYAPNRGAPMHSLVRVTGILLV